MADEQHEVRHVKWDEIFSFTHIFKSGRMALQPSKLLLAMAAIILLYVTGWVMDRVWLIGDQRVRTGEIRLHATSDSVAFGDAQRGWKEFGRHKSAIGLARGTRAQRRDLSEYRKLLTFGAGGPAGAAFNDRLTKYNDGTDKDLKPFDKATIDGFQDKSWSAILSTAEKEFEEEVSKIEKLLDKIDDDVDTKARRMVDARTEKLSGKAKAQAKARVEIDRDKGLVDLQMALSKRRREFAKNVIAITGRPIFQSFLDHQAECLSGIIRSAWRVNIFGGLDNYLEQQKARGVKAITVGASGEPIRPQTPGQPRACGVLFWLLMACHGLGWLICRHWVYALVYLLIALAVWALFGGAIHRIAALHAARGEKISLVQGLRFSLGKFLSYFTAPLIPLSIIFGLGLLFLSLGGFALGNFLGGLVMAILFILALIMGFAIAFLVIGLVTGAGLMYPTIAVEGSDSFDAISRSFSYVFARPWRTCLYAFVALIYGGLCYLFLRVFVFVALKTTHWFVKIGVFGNGASLAENADRMDKLWQAPTFFSLHAPLSWSAMSGGEALAAFIIAIWVNLIIVMLLAYLVTYFASAATTVYCLLRQKVDATDLDDVYIEEAEEELPEPETEQPPAEEAPAEDQAPAEEESGGQAESSPE